MKKIICMLLAVVLVFGLVACGGKTAPAENPEASNTETPGDSSVEPKGSSEGSPVSARDTLNVAISGDNGTLLPTKIWGNFIGIVRSYMEVLLDYIDGDLVWVLATGIDQVTPTQWTIHLREGVTFSNGNPFNAEDVMFTLQYYLSEPMVASYLNCIDLENTKIIDDYTIELALTHYAMQQLGSFSMVYMFDKESFDADDFVTHPIGTGPYVVTEYTINSHVYMERNDNYWGDKAIIKNLHFKVFNEDAQIVNAIQSGTVDISAVPAQDIEFVKTLPNYQLTEYYSQYAANLSFNLTPESPLHDLDARLAVCYATNRSAMVDLAFFGSADVVNLPVSAHCYDYYPELDNQHDVYATGFNVEKAKELAEKSGLVGKTLHAITNGTSTYVTIAEILQTNLRDIGVTLEIENYDNATYMANSYDPTKFDIAIYGIASPQGFAVAMLYEYVLWGEPIYKDWEGYSKLVELGAEAVGNSDEASRKDQLLEMVKLFEEGCPWYAICDQKNSLAINKDIAGISLSIVGGGTLSYYKCYWVK